MCGVSPGLLSARTGTHTWLILCHTSVHSRIDCGGDHMLHSDGQSHIYVALPCMIPIHVSFSTQCVCLHKRRRMKDESWVISYNDITISNLLSIIAMW